MHQPNEQVLPLPEGARYELLHNDRIGGVPGLPDYYNVRSIARALEKFGNERFMGVVPISGAKVPIGASPFRKCCLQCTFRHAC